MYTVDVFRTEIRTIGIYKVRHIQIIKVLKLNTFLNINPLINFQFQYIKV